MNNECLAVRRLYSFACVKTDPNSINVELLSRDAA